MFKMYKKNAEDRNGNGSDKELIDISSDDESGKIEDIVTEKNRSLAVTGSSAKLPQKSSHSCGITKTKTIDPLATKNDESNQKVSLIL